ncbi:protease Do-like 9 isoform X1 [Rhododendron vialii]|uniref:protease Do-like 9 isoform X1 n=2 Tax=Rhododendron vialii TaxID=182163 RepID=UPI00265FFBFF|nr:protease Do-like 9 isoform X1 [Rhododendron vialii]
MLAATSSSPIAIPPFFNKLNKAIHIDSKKSVRLPSLVSSSSSSKLLHTSFQSFLSIPSSHDDRVDHCARLRKCNSTTVIRSFYSRASVRDEEVSSLGKKLLDKDYDEEDDGGDLEEYGRIEDMPQLHAVVMVICTTAEPDVSSPWRKEQNDSYGRGLILSGRRVLTTAHSVDHHTQLKVVKYDFGTEYTEYTATMLAIAPECDLAILTVNDDEFWNGVKPVEFGDMPSPGDKVIITRLREDRDYLPLVTTCVLSSGMTRYSFWGTELLAFQINVGLSGATCSGPAFDERCKCVGLKLQSENYKSDFIPAEVIKHFIQDYDKHGAYTGLPLLGIKWQEMENLYLRMLMNMEHDEQGVLITEVKPNYPESAILKPNDVILSIDGININNDGTVPFLRGRRIEFSYLIGKKYVGDKIVIKVRRGFEICEFITELATHIQFVPANIIGRPLRYYIIGGFVFTTLSFPYMQVMDDRYNDDERPDEDELLFQALYEERVVLLEVLKADINAGYETEFTLQNQVLVTFNYKPVEGLNSLVSMVETCNEDFMKFTFGNKKTLVLPTNIARSRTPDILKAHSVSCDMSDDLKKLVKLTRGEESQVCI